MRLTIVGCSGSMAGPTSPASSYVVQADGVGPDGHPRTYSVLLDLGSGAFGPLQALTDVAQIDAVALSHLHPDHCADMTGLYVWQRYGPLGQRSPLPVFGPDGTSSRLTDLCLTEPEEIEVTFAVAPWVEQVPIQIGPLTLTPFEVLHPVPAYGIRVSGPSEDPSVGTVSLGYTGDTDVCVGVIAMAQGVDVLLAEAGFADGAETIRGIHLTGERAGGVARDAGVGRLLLTHIQPWSDSAAIAEAARAQFSGPVEIVRPNGTWTF